jgi:hypothetical protein
MPFVARKVKHRTADHHICKAIRKRHPLDWTYPEILRGQSRPERGRQLPNMLNTRGVRVQREYLAPLAQQMHQVSSIPASSVEHTHIRCDVSAKNLIEYVDIDLAKLLLNA